MQMTSVAEYADVLRNPDLKLYEDGWYTSQTTGKRGYRAIFFLGREWYWYSVSGTAVKVSPLEVADAITSPHKRIDRSGSYKKNGFEATVRVEEHSYMLNAGDSKPA
jgi:hypothetical protein